MQGRYGQKVGTVLGESGVNLAKKNKDNFKANVCINVGSICHGKIVGLSRDLRSEVGK